MKTCAQARGAVSCQALTLPSWQWRLSQLRPSTLVARLVQHCHELTQDRSFGRHRPARTKQKQPLKSNKRSNSKHRVTGEVVPKRAPTGSHGHTSSEAGERPINLAER